MNKINVFSEEEAEGERQSNKSKREKPPRDRKVKKSYLLTILLVAALVAAGTIGYIEYDNLKKENALLSNPQEAAKAETEQLKKDVAQHIQLPKNEDPTVYTVVDAGKLKKQTFFKNTQNGDKVLLFPQAKKAILYRPSIDKIIEVSPINIGDQEENIKNSQLEADNTDTN